MGKINKVFRTYQSGKNNSGIEQLQELFNDGWTVITQSIMPASRIEDMLNTKYLYGYIEYILEKEVDV